MSNLPAGAEHDSDAPWNETEENECAYCGNPCERTYCSNGCKTADLD